MSERGAYLIASNSDPTGINKDDDFFDKLYQNHTIHRLIAQRPLSTASDRQNRVKEILIVSKNITVWGEISPQTIKMCTIW